MICDSCLDMQCEYIPDCTIHCRMSYRWCLFRKPVSQLFNKQKIPVCKVQYFQLQVLQCSIFGIELGLIPRKVQGRKWMPRHLLLLLRHGWCAGGCGGGGSRGRWAGRAGGTPLSWGGPAARRSRARRWRSVGSPDPYRGAGSRVAAKTSTCGVGAPDICHGRERVERRRATAHLLREDMKI